MTRSTVPALPALVVVLGSASCASLPFAAEDARWPEYMRGTTLVGAATGWAFVEGDVDLENGSGPLADPILGGSDVGSSTTDLDPVFGAALKLLHFFHDDWTVGFIFEHRIFDPDSTRPLSADVDIDDFATNHFIGELRYWFPSLGSEQRWRPFAAVQLGYVPEVDADGEVHYEPISSLGLPATTEMISLKGDEFWTLGAVVGASYLLREGMTLDFATWYEFALDATEDQLTLQPHPGAPVVGDPTTYDGEIFESGLYFSVGLSWAF